MIIETIRAASTADASTIADLVNSAYRPVAGQSGWTHESNIIAGDRTNTHQVLAKILQHDATIFIGLRAAAIVGCICVDKDGADCHLGMFAVAPALQGSGAGKQLLAHAERYAIEKFKAGTLKMRVISCRTELIDFYLRRGYQRGGPVMGYPCTAATGVPKHPALTIEWLKKPANTIDCSFVAESIAGNTT
jgi:GNAT superfamily N-acetyltransferase